MLDDPFSAGFAAPRTRRLFGEPFARLGDVRLSPALRRWLLCWVLLPNIAFILLWSIATPPRTSAIVTAGAIGFLTRRAPFPVKLGGFVLALAYSALSFLAAIFNLEMIEVVEATDGLRSLDPTQSPTYIAALAFSVAVVGAGAWLCARDTDIIRSGEMVLAATAVFAVAALDHAVSFGSRGSYKRIAPAEAPFESAVRQTGIAGALAERRHVLVVVVESMGVPRDAVIGRLMFAPWRRRDIARRYDVSFGTTAFYGSTVNAEMREFCGRWDDYDAVAARPDHGCLPAVAVTQGYRTTAAHGFSGSFFDRQRWYPNIGFQDRVFDETMARMGLARCGGVFAGTCDREIPALLAGRLKAAKEPQFLYWLTLNSHLPVPASDAMGTRDCAAHLPDLRGSGTGLCRLVSVVRSTGESLADMLADPNLPATEVLIVGDHMPPFFDHASRSRFDHERVPWIRLRPRQPAR